MRHAIAILICLVFTTGNCAGQTTGRIHKLRGLPAQFVDLPTVRNFDEIGTHAGKTVVCLGKYKCWDWDLPNEEAFQGQAILYLSDGRRVLIGNSLNEECNRPTDELKRLHRKKVIIVGTIYMTNPATIGYSSLNASHIQDLQYIGRR